MHRYQLYGEWREVSLWGDSLADALTRRGVLRMPDRYERGKMVREGEEVPVARVVGMVNTSHSTRGGGSFERALVELVGGRIVEVDARRTSDWLM